MLCHDGHQFECIAVNELQIHLTLFVCLLFDTQRSSADIGADESDEADEAARTEAHSGAVRRG